LSGDEQSRDPPNCTPWQATALPCAKFYLFPGRTRANDSKANADRLNAQGHINGAVKITRGYELAAVSIPHSHSIVLSDRSALNFKCKIFPHLTKDVSPIRQKFAILNSKENFDATISLVSETIDINRSIFLLTHADPIDSSKLPKDRHKTLASRTVRRAIAASCNALPVARF
jgi:hypothetical protein